MTKPPVGKAYRGALNATEGATLLGHAIGEAVARAKVDPAEVEDVVMGCAMQQGTMVMNGARKGAIRAGLPITVGTSVAAGPAVSASFPLGDYIEDYQYVAGSGDLDQYNGRFVVTPDYPQGT